MALTDNLVGWWDLDDAANQNATDDHASYDLTDNNNIAASSGTGPGSQDVRDLNAGASEWFWHADDANFSGASADFGMCGWAYPDLSTSYRPWIGKASAFTTAGIEYSVYRNNGANPMSFGVGTGTAAEFTRVDTTNTVSTGSWYWICAWHDNGTNIHIQLDADTPDNGSPAHTEGSQDTAGQFQIGNCPGAPDSFDGQMAMWGFWNGRFPDSGERSTLYNSGSGLQYADFPSGAAYPYYYYAQCRKGAKPEDIKRDYWVLENVRFRLRLAARRDRLSMQYRPRWRRDPKTGIYYPPAEGIVTPRYFIGRAA